MKEEVHAPDCGQENDLVAFLYGELDPSEKRVFRRHLQECSSCSEELAEFTSIRESVVDWRNEALVGVTGPAVQALPVVRPDVTRHTALTALRQFFNLSPLWMKGAVVFASLLFCLFAVLAVARLRDPAPRRVAVIPDVRKYSDQELNTIVNQRVHDELQRIRNSSEPAPKSPVIAKGGSNRVSPGKATNRVSEVASAGSQKKARRPLSKVERQQLAADLRLIGDPIESEFDFLDDRINQ